MSKTTLPDIADVLEVRLRERGAKKPRKRKGEPEAREELPVVLLHRMDKMNPEKVYGVRSSTVMVELKYQPLSKATVLAALADLECDRPLQKSPAGAQQSHDGLWSREGQNMKFSVRFRRYKEYCTFTIY